MLHRPSTRACKCASTSTALVACAHVHAVVRGLRSPPRSPFATEAGGASIRHPIAGTSSGALPSSGTTSPAYHHAALIYTAPLWHQEQWHHARSGKAWHNWFSHSRVPLALDPQTPRPQPPPPHRASPRPSFRTIKPAPGTRSIDEGTRESIARYLASRTRPSTEHTVDELSNDDQAWMLAPAKRLGMAVVANYLLLDLAATNALSRELEQTPSWPQWLDPREALQNLVDHGTPLKELAIAMPQLADNAERIQALWKAFRDKYELDQHPMLALKFLHFVARPNPNDAPLAFALEVLQDLVRTSIVSEQLVSPPPAVPETVPDANSIALRIVLLRTVVAAAREHADDDLAVQALQSLDSLNHVGEIDIGLLQIHLSKQLEWARYQRLELYRPLSNTTMERLHSLFVSLLKRWDPSLSAATKGMLDAFAIELIEYNRLDLLAELYSQFSRSGWAPTLSSDVTLNFAHFLGGDGRTRQYRFPSNPTRKEASTTRYIYVDLWNRFTATVEERAIEEGFGNDWTREAKDRWLRHLCHGRIVNPAQARNMYDLWTVGSHLRGVVAAPSPPLVVSTATALALANRLLQQSSRSSSVDHKNTRAFVQRLASDCVRYRTSSSNGKLEHYDLTALARLYLLVDDWDSVAQVYRHLLAHKVFPDQRDIEVWVELAARRFWTLEQGASSESQAVLDKILDFIAGRRLIVDTRILQSVARAVMSELKSSPDVPRVHHFTLAKFVDWANELLLLPPRDYAILRKILLYPDKSKPLSSARQVSPFAAGRFGDLFPSRVVHALSKAYSRGQIGEALLIYRETVLEGGLRFDLALRQTLQVFSSWLRKEPVEWRGVWLQEVVLMLQETLEAGIDIAEEEKTMMVVITTLRKNWDSAESQDRSNRFQLAQDYVQRYRTKVGDVGPEVEKAMREFLGNLQSLET
ncbi:BQ2448_7765 [Microbotryum intermedium]|uniref:BQ2448_7765 protein n=1 Tax=Microbotryum intermedium TaxID=269621 RepID=A0A238FUJ3_9BASI|nr:BQ2448_7765 [Microbotryum intermedium]